VVVVQDCVFVLLSAVCNVVSIVNNEEVALVPSLGWVRGGRSRVSRRQAGGDY